jgi:hypothetical protein
MVVINKNLIGVCRVLINKLKSYIIGILAQQVIKFKI